MAFISRKVAFFGASGSLSGSGVKNILGRCHGNMHPCVRPHLVISCNPHGGVAQIAHDFDVPFMHFQKPYDDPAQWKSIFDKHDAEYLVLLGCSIRVVGMQDFIDRMMNEHPADLTVLDDRRHPRFGGRGMTDLHVHKAVVASGATKSATTSHYVYCGTGTDADYDAGNLIINVHHCDVPADRRAESLQNEVKALQKARTPYDVEALVRGKVRLVRDGVSSRVVWN